MKPLTRNLLTTVSVVYLVTVGVLVGRVPLTVLNPLLVFAVGPLVWLLWAFCRWSAYQHARSEEKAIEKVHGPSFVAQREAVRR